MTGGGGAAEPIAIVGIGCRLPGGIDDPGAFWDALLAETDAVTEIPADRFDVDALYDERPATSGRIMSRYGGFVDGIETVDADFFGLSTVEAERLDPQQRLLLETAWSALEDGGIPIDTVAGSPMGVFVGLWLNEYESRLFRDLDGIDFHMTVGTGRYSASGRLSYLFDAFGPSITIDTACSSSLVAVHLGVESLRTGETDLVLAGGANVVLEPFITIAYSQSKMMAPDGRCKFGDAAANGYVRSDGAAMVALKRLSDAERDHDHVYAVIRGSSVTNDGRSSGYLATPGRAGQAEMLRRAYQRGDVDPVTVGYVEAHGTGTAAGDPVEIGAIADVLGAGRPLDAPCLVGSVKTNLGHTEGAAGVTGLIKTALALEAGEIPASLHVATPNPDIPWADHRVAVAAERSPWPGPEPRRAGVSSFGIAGTNAHVVLEQAPAALDASSGGAPSPLVLPLSTRRHDALPDLARAWLDTIGTAPLADLCAAGTRNRSHLEHRAAIVADDESTARAALHALIDGEPHPALVAGSAGRASRTVFVFPGQGSQWVGMARELLGHGSAFTDEFHRVAAAVEAEVDWSPAAVVLDDAESPQLEQIDVIQPVLFIIEAALAAQWRAWGCEPDAVIGHSMGEVAAAYVAGALDAEQAAAVICRRSRLMRRVSGRGAMAVVDLPADEAAREIAADPRLSVAVANSPRSTVIAGDPDAVDDVLTRLTERDVFCRPIAVDVASHSPQVDPLLDDLRETLGDLSPRPTTIPFHSTVHGRELAGPDLDASYWVDNLRQPVQFGQAIAAEAENGSVVFVEMSPHPILLPAIDQTLTATGAVGTSVASLSRDEPGRHGLALGLAAAFAGGSAIDWAARHPGPVARVVLPPQPWRRERHWLDRTEPGPGADGHPLLGRPFRSPDDPRTRVWDTPLSDRRLEALHDHVVRGAAVLPASGMLEFLATALDTEVDKSHDLVDVTFDGLLPLADAETRLQTVVRGIAGPAPDELELVATTPDGDHRRHAGARTSSAEPIARLDVAAVTAVCDRTRAADDHTAATRRRGLAYGPAFAGLDDILVGPRQARATIAPDVDASTPHVARMQVVDLALQAAFAALPPDDDRLLVPVSIGRVQGRLADPAAARHTHASIEHDGGDHVVADVSVTAPDGEVLVRLTAVRFDRLGAPADGLLHRLVWTPLEAAVPTDPASERWLLVGEGPDVETLSTALSASGAAVTTAATTDEVAAALDRLADDGDDTTPMHVVHGAELAGIEPPIVEDRALLRPLALIRTLAGHAGTTRLSFVTSGAQSGRLVGAALTTGVARTAAAEHPELGVRLIDHEAASGPELLAELTAGDAPPEVALDDATRLHPEVARSAAPPAAWAHTGAETADYAVRPTVPGDLSGVRAVASPPRSPAPGEVRIRIEASGINFLDVLKALGAYPGVDPSPTVAIGAECAGVVDAVGPGVERVRAGDAVVAITSDYHGVSLLGSHAVVPEAFVAPRPGSLDAHHAAAQPVAYLTAHHALVTVAGIAAGEVALIHAASGGVGLAAIEICRRAGVEVIATAGTDAKRTMLRELGVTHVFDSRSTTFSEQAQAVTGGRGVDVVLGAVTGDAIEAGIRCLAPRGRYVEIGKADLFDGHRIPLALLRDNRSYLVVDLAGLTLDRPDLVAGEFQTVVADLASGTLAPLPVTTMPVDAVADAFREIAAGAHTGKLVITHPGSTTAVTTPSAADGVVVVSGGLGALGLLAARELAVRGARRLALLGRSDPEPAAEAAIAALRSDGAEVAVHAVDVADRASLAPTLERVRDDLGPITGVVHAAGVLADSTIASMDEATARAAVAPKFRGAQNLHDLTLDDPIELFVLFSSIAGWLGLPGQANYAAGNAALDALARRRRGDGLPASSIAWGPWDAVGLAATEARGGRLSAQGLAGLDPDAATAVFGTLADTAPADHAVMAIDPVRWATHNPANGHLFGESTTDHADAASAGALLEQLADVPDGPMRLALVETEVAAQLAAVLRKSTDAVDHHRAFEAMGLDSLLALELRNRLESVSGVTLSATMAFNHPTVHELARHLASKLPTAERQPDTGAPVPAAAHPAEPTATADLEELGALLAAELDAVDRLLDGDS